MIPTGGTSDCCPSSRPFSVSATSRRLRDTSLEGPLGVIQRFPIPGDRWLNVTPEQLRGQWVRMNVRLLKGEQPEMNASLRASPGAPAIFAGPPYGRGVLIIILWANPNPAGPAASRRSREGPVSEERYREERARIEQGHVKYRAKLKEEGKLFVRDRLRLLLDPGSDFQEDFLFARNQEPDTPADGVVTGRRPGRAAAPCASWPMTTR